MNNPIKLLLLDDDNEVRSNLKFYLEDEGFDCTDFESAEQALNDLEHHVYDLAIVDLRLPGIDGETFIRSIINKYPGLQYIIYTGSTNYDMNINLIKHGLSLRQNVLFKPVEDMSIFVSKIHNLLKTNDT